MMNKDLRSAWVIHMALAFAALHLFFDLAIALRLLGPESGMFYLAVDFPLALACDYAPGLWSALEEISDRMGFGHHPYFDVVFGTATYAAIGALVGVAIHWRRERRRRSDRA